MSTTRTLSEYTDADGVKWLIGAFNTVGGALLITRALYDDGRVALSTTTTFIPNGRVIPGDEPDTFQLAGAQQHIGAL